MKKNIAKFKNYLKKKVLYVLPQLLNAVHDIYPNYPSMGCFSE